MATDRGDLVMLPFRTGTLHAVRVGERQYASLLPLCEQGGLNFNAVWDFLSRNRETFSWLDLKWEVIDQTGRRREGLFVNVEHLPSLPGYLLHLTPPGPLRDRFETLVAEARDVLADYFFRGVAVNPRFTPEAIRMRLAELDVERLKLSREILASGSLDPRHELILKESVANRLLLEMGQAQKGTEFVTVSSRYHELGYPPTAVTDSYKAIGIKASDFYFRKHGRRPPRDEKHPQIVNGAVRPVNTYTTADLADVIDPAIHEWCRERGISPHH
jgi:hypothetical protein